MTRKFAITNHPVLSAFAVAVVLCVAAAVVWPFTRQEAPWALTFIVVCFPFVWFFAWVFINTLAWWRDTTGPDE